MHARIVVRQLNTMFVVVRKRAISVHSDISRLETITGVVAEVDILLEDSVGAASASLAAMRTSKKERTMLWNGRNGVFQGFVSVAFAKHIVLLPSFFYICHCRKAQALRCQKFMLPDCRRL